jgi:hypothetical protein
MLVGGYTGTLAVPVSANFVDFLVFSGSMLSTSYRTGTISNAAADGGAKKIRIGGDLFVVNISPYSSTFYIHVGGATSTLAITSSGPTVYSTATVAAATWSGPYSYKYWTQAVYYEEEDDPTECPAWWVPVLTSDGYRPAQDITAGTVLITRPEDGEWGEYPVEYAKHAENEVFSLITTDGRRVEVSRDHRWLVSGSWRRVQDLLPGDVIDGIPPGVVKDVQFKGRERVMQLHVSGAMTMLLDGLLAHNIKP